MRGYHCKVQKQYLILRDKMARKQKPIFGPEMGDNCKQYFGEWQSISLQSPSHIQMSIYQVLPGAQVSIFHLFQTCYIYVLICDHNMYPLYCMVLVLRELSTIQVLSAKWFTVQQQSRPNMRARMGQTNGRDEILFKHFKIRNHARLRKTN